MDIFEAQRLEFLPQPPGAGGFPEGRRRDLSQLPLPAPEFHLLVVKKEERRMDATHLGDAGDLPRGGEPRSVRNRGAGGHLSWINTIYPVAPSRSQKIKRLAIPRAANH